MIFRVSYHLDPTSIDPRIALKPIFFHFVFVYHITAFNKNDITQLHTHMIIQHYMQHYIQHDIYHAANMNATLILTKEEGIKLAKAYTNFIFGCCEYEYYIYLYGQKEKQLAIANANFISGYCED